jgi:putative SOS response-associated peptidase YedK
MCGRFTLSTSPDALQRAFPTLGIPPDYRPRYNIAPTQSVLAVRVEEGEPRACWLRWGLVPFWAKDPAMGNRMINARAETVATKPSFRNAYRQRRCVVLADGYYEWMKVGPTKVPMRIRLPDDSPFTLAGLWERWAPSGGEPLETCTLITTAATPGVAAIHDRMPVILEEDARRRWLDPATPTGELGALLTGYDGVLDAYAVSTVVNSPANDRPDCLVPAPTKYRPPTSGAWLWYRNHADWVRTGSGPNAAPSTDRRVCSKSWGVMDIRVTTLPRSPGMARRSSSSRIRSK